MRHVLIACSLAAGAAAADRPATEVRLGLDGGITHEDRLDVNRDNGTEGGGGVEARPWRLTTTLLRSPWGIGKDGGVVLGGDAYYARSRGGARGDLVTTTGAVTTVETRSLGLGLDAGYAYPVAPAWTAEGMLSLSYFSESIRAEFHVANDTRTAEDDFGGVGWESAIKLGVRYAATPAWSVGFGTRIILWNRATARFNNEDVLYRQRGWQLGVDAGYRF